MNDIIEENIKPNKKEQDFTYPNVNDEDIQSKIYTKREFYYHKMPERPKIKNDEDIMKYRKKVCTPSGSLPHQDLISNFINPNTPYKGLIVYHGTGTGKTFVGITTAEKFKEQFQRYNTKAHIIVPGPIIKQKWKKDIITGTGDTYLKQNESLIFMNEEDLKKQMSKAEKASQEFYRIHSYKGFSKKILGDKIITKQINEKGKIVSKAKKSSFGSYEREFKGERIYSLDNSLLIVDEAQNFVNDSDNSEALQTIIENSINLKILLLSATPMNNKADEIISLLNYLRPKDDPIERSKMFNSKTNYEMDLKPDGLEYFKKMSSGYISHLRGADPLTFALKNEYGVKPKGLMFTKLVQCQMNKFQLDTYNQVIKKLEVNSDGLDTKQVAVSNFTIPILDENKKNIIGSYGSEGLKEIKNQIKNNYDTLNKLIGTQILNEKNSKEEFINYNNETNNITGKILNKKYIKYFSQKFYTIIDDIDNNLFKSDKNNSSIGFVYSRLVSYGINLFQEILLENGYLEYDENSTKYNIKDNTICYYCGIQKQNHKNTSTHTFKPATFLKLTGQDNDDTNVEQDVKVDYVDKVYSNIKNKEGKNIKLLLGSKVLTSGFSLKNVGSVQIIEAPYTLGEVEQIVGRGIRWCSHMDVMNINNMYPKVKVFKYVSSLKNKMSAEEELYYKAEIKYLLIKKVERAMKENAIDCPLNFTANMFEEEMKQHNKCKEPNEDMRKEAKTELNNCPALCDFTVCNYKCDGKELNLKYYDRTTNIYKKLNKKELDYSTFTLNMAKKEINSSKEKIKELFIVNYIYKLDTIVDYIKNSYDDDKKELYSNFFTYKALDELIPITQNDFNNFTDIIYDKTYTPGYLIYLDGYYIFQPFDKSETLPLYYRKNPNIQFDTELSLNTFLKLNPENIEKELELEEEEDYYDLRYDFLSVYNYYKNRNEFSFVGIIDKETETTNKTIDKLKDVFKLRSKLNKLDNKKRGTNIQTFKGSVCHNSKTRKYLDDIAIKLKIKDFKNYNRENLCKKIMEKLYQLEKYSTGNNKKTYLVIPANHPKYKFPINLEDRVEYLKEKVFDILQTKVKFNKKSNKNKTEYILSFENNVNNEDKEILLKDGWNEKKKNNFEIIIE